MIIFRSRIELRVHHIMYTELRVHQMLFHCIASIKSPKYYIIANNININVCKKNIEQDYYEWINKQYIFVSQQQEGMPKK